MKYVLALAGGICVLAQPAQAASPQVETAIQALSKMEADPVKFRAFCTIVKELAAVEEQNLAKAEALDKQLDELLRTMGQDVFNAWDLGADLDPRSEDGMAFDAAVEALEDKCGE